MSRPKCPVTETARSNRPNRNGSGPKWLRPKRPDRISQTESARSKSRVPVNSSFPSFWINDIWQIEFSWNEVVRGDSRRPTNGTRSEKVWEPLLYSICGGIKTLKHNVWTTLQFAYNGCKYLTHTSKTCQIKRSQIVVTVRFTIRGFLTFSHW